MVRCLASAVLLAGLLCAEFALAGVTSGQVVVQDRERQLVQLDDGTTYFVPNRVNLRDFRPRRWVTIWFSVRDGVRVVVNHEVRRNRDD